MSNFALKTNAFLKKSTRDHGIPGFSEICVFAVCGGVFCTFAYSRGLFTVNLLNFLQKYRCVSKIRSRLTIFCQFPLCSSEVSDTSVPKIVFWADIFSSISFIFFRSIVVYLKLGSRLTFLLTV